MLKALPLAIHGGRRIGRDIQSPFGSRRRRGGFFVENKERVRRE